MWMMMGPGHMAFFFSFFPLHLYTIRLKGVLAQGIAVVVMIMLIMIKEAIKAEFVGRDDIYFLKLTDAFEKIRQLSVT